MKISLKTKRDLTKDELIFLSGMLEVLASSLSREISIKKFTKIFFEETESPLERLFISLLDTLNKEIRQELKIILQKKDQVALEEDQSKIQYFRIITPLELVSELATIPSSGPKKARPTNSSIEGGDQYGL